MNTGVSSFSFSTFFEESTFIEEYTFRTESAFLEEPSFLAASIFLAAGSIFFAGISLAGAGRPNKGVHQAGFLVLRETSMPGCLIELGFITTPDEERLLNDNAKVDDIAKGIYEAFAKYKNKYPS